MNRDEVFAQAQEAVQERGEQYGTIQENFGRVAKMWSAYFGIEVKPHDVAQCLTLFKICRTKANPEHPDSWVDEVAYPALGAELALKDLDASA